MHEKGKILKLLGLMIAAALLFIALPATEAMAQGGTTWTVCPDGNCDFTTIQAAIDAATDEDTINVGPGTYNESIVVDKAVVLLGAQANVDPRPSQGGRTGAESVIVSDQMEGDIAELQARHVDMAAGGMVEGVAGPEQRVGMKVRDLEGGMQVAGFIAQRIRIMRNDAIGDALEIAGHISEGGAAHHDNESQERDQNP